MPLAAHRKGFTPFKYLIALNCIYKFSVKIELPKFSRISGKTWSRINMDAWKKVFAPTCEDCTGSVQAFAASIETETKIAEIVDFLKVFNLNYIKDIQKFTHPTTPTFFWLILGTEFKMISISCA